MRPATRDDVCGYCGENIWVHMKHQIGTSPWYTWKEGDPGEPSSWIHDWCVYKLRDIEIAKDEAKAAEALLQQQALPSVPLQEHDTKRKLISAQDVSKILGCSDSKVYNLMDHGEIDWLYVGARRKAYVDSVDAFMQRRSRMRVS